MYVGSAVTSRIGNRFHKHPFGGSGSVPVATAVAKYGLGEFAFILLETIPGIISSTDNSKLLALENHYFKLLSPSYNLAPEAGNTYGVLHTAETKALMSANYSLARREAIGTLNRGKTFSPITISRLVAAAKARLPMTAQTKDLVSLNSANAEFYELSLVNGGPLTSGLMFIVLRTIPMVAEYVTCHEKTVRRTLSGNHIIKGK